MWIVRLALNRPYTFIVLAILIPIAAPVTILRTPTDIFPNINIPVISVAWQYTGLSPEELEGRLTSIYERTLTALVDNIEHLESTTYKCVVVTRIYLQPGRSVDRAMAQTVATSQYVLKSLPPGLNPPEIRPWGSKCLINACMDYRFIKSFSKRTKLSKQAYDNVVARWQELGLSGTPPLISV